jgi:hypothetical protein
MRNVELYMTNDYFFFFGGLDDTLGVGAATVSGWIVS